MMYRCDGVWNCAEQNCTYLYTCNYFYNRCEFNMLSFRKVTKWLFTLVATFMEVPCASKNVILSEQYENYITRQTFLKAGTEKNPIRKQ